MVRFIDNFSRGERGASSAETFCREGYKVLFIYRLGTITPFSRGLRKGVSEAVDDKFLNRLKISGNLGEVVLSSSADAESDKSIKDDICKFKHYQGSNSLLALPFESVDEYLSLLRLASQELNELGPRACFYLSAAVSDFYIPADEVNPSVISPPMDW